MCEIVLKVKYIAHTEKDALIECETAEAAEQRMIDLQALGTVAAITWFTKSTTHTRRVVYESDAT